jgi:putative addiction module antidote
MANTIKITTIGNSVGIVLPKETLGRLRAAKGDLLYITDTPDGIQLTAYDATFAEQMDAARVVMRKHRDVLRKLAE